ncbi:hypothetical protein TI05_05340 [Achromatium sp. WMS3]|nr:hypothetical protein TI05_05340 [Achromatium sp. WMS3]
MNFINILFSAIHRFMAGGVIGLGYGVVVSGLAFFMLLPITSIITQLILGISLIGNYNIQHFGDTMFGGGVFVGAVGGAFFSLLLGSFGTRKNGMIIAGIVGVIIGFILGIIPAEPHRYDWDIEYPIVQAILFLAIFSISGCIGGLALGWTIRNMFSRSHAAQIKDIPKSSE